MTRPNSKFPLITKATITRVTTFSTQTEKPVLLLILRPKEKVYFKGLKINYITLALPFSYYQIDETILKLQELNLIPKASLVSSLISLTSLLDHKEIVVELRTTWVKGKKSLKPHLVENQLKD